MIKKDLDVKLEKTTSPRPRPDEASLGFGSHFTDHMFVMRWNRAQGWHEARITAYAPLDMDPAAMVFHYGQAVFEGLKAYRGKDDQIFLFRPQDNLKRLNDSALRMCMARIPGEAVLKVIKSLVYLDRDWVPRLDEASLYLRPTLIASEPALGLRPAEEYIFFIIMSPVGPYYPQGFQPVDIYVSDNYVRASPGGVGAAKTGGNYAASLKAFEEAKAEGYTQVLWLDARERRWIEEVGTSNIFFVIKGELITPPLTGTILPGITRDSVIQMARDRDMKVSERPIAIDEVVEAARAGTLDEAFGTGTAAVISPVGKLRYGGEDILINNGETGAVARELYEDLLALQCGHGEDPHGWRIRVA